MPEKNSGLNGIRTRDFCDTRGRLPILSYQANWELATLWVRNIPVDGEEYWVNIWKFIHLNYGEWYEDMIDHRSYAHNLSSCQTKKNKKIRPERDSNPWPLRCQCSTRPTELSSQLGVDHGYMGSATSWPDSSVGRALHRHRKGHGFESRSGLNFFQA